MFRKKNFLKGAIKGMAILGMGVIFFGVSEADTWVKAYGGRDACGRCIRQTQDGGYIVVGRSEVLKKMWLLRLSPNGDSIWAKALIDTYSIGHCIQITSDNGYIIAGEIGYLGDMDKQACLIKTDSLGNVIWSKTYGGSQDDGAFFVDQTFDGGYIVTGYTKSFGDVDGNIYLIKVDSNGDVVWDTNYGGINEDGGKCVLQASDSGYIITGYTSEGNCLLKVDSLGNLVWSKTHGGNHVAQTLDGGYIIVGMGDNNCTYLIKTNANGDTMWTKRYFYGGPSDDYSEGKWVEQTSDGGYIITGYAKFWGEKRMLIIRTDSDGNVMWDRDYYLSTYGGYCVQETFDKGYIVSGYDFFTGCVVMKTDSLGFVIFEDCSLRGTVRDETTDDPIEGAEISIFLSNFTVDRDTLFIASTTSNSNGEYELIFDSYGPIYIFCNKSGYGSEWWDDADSIEDASTIYIQGGTSSGIDFRLQSNIGGISGNVRDTVGAPIAGALVHAFGSDIFHDGTAYTDTNGNYEIPELLADSYYIEVFASGYPHEFYDNVDSISNATRVNVVGNEVASGIDFVLGEVDTSGRKHVGGTVIDSATGNPITGCIVIAFSRTSVEVVSITDASGEYIIRGLKDEPYYLYAWADGYVGKYYPDAYRWEDASQVTPDAEDIDFDLLPAVKTGKGGVCGKITTSEKDGVGVENAFVLAIKDNMLVGCTRSWADGRYIIAELPEGNYTIRASKAFYNTEDYGQTVEVSGKTVPDINISLTKVGIEESEEFTKPTAYLRILSSNPSCKDVTIAYRLGTPAHTTLNIYDITGKLVRTLVNSLKSADLHIISWDRKDNRGNEVPTGIYFCKLQAGEVRTVQKIMLIR